MSSILICEHGGYLHGCTQCAYQRGLAEGRQQITRGHYQNGYEDGLNAGVKLGREEERAAIVAWLELRAKNWSNMPQGYGLGRHDAFGIAAQEITQGRHIERADHLRPDIKDGEGEQT